MPKFAFSYGMDDVCYDPCSPYFIIEAESIETANVIARSRFEEFLFKETCEKWVHEDSGYGYRWKHYPATNRTGYLGNGHEQRPVKPSTQPTVWPKWDEKTAEAIAAVTSQPILQAIQQAPVFAARFSGPLSEIEDTGFSIPLTLVGETVYEPPPDWVPDNHS